MEVEKTDIDLMKKLLTMKESALFNLMHDLLRTNFGYKVTRFKNVLYAKGDIPVGLLAHVDTVYKEQPDIIFHDEEYNLMWTPQGLGADDRAGIFAILKILQTGRKPTVIITKGEESGGIGAYELVSKMKNYPKDLNFLIQLDRQGFDDAVFYKCANKKFEKYITGFGFKTQLGTFTDISIIAPAWKVAAVNLSVGYINEHSVVEHWFYDSCFDTIDKVRMILDDVAINKKDTKFKYIPAKEKGRARRYYDYYESFASEVSQATV